MCCDNSPSPLNRVALRMAVISWALPLGLIFFGLPVLVVLLVGIGLLWVIP